MRIALFGAGSIGGPIAVHLANAGEDVTVFAGNPQIAQTIERDGFLVTGLRGEHRARLKAKLSPTRGDGPFDVALLAMKSDRLREGVENALPVLSPEGFVVCLQNGVPEPTARAIAGDRRVVGGIVGWGSSMEAPGRARITSRGRITFGEPGSSDSERVRQLVGTFTRAGLSSKATTNLDGARWSKLAINCTISTLGGVSGMLLGQLVAVREFRLIAFTVMSEVADVARAAGVRMEKVAGTFDIKAVYVPREGDSSLFHGLTRHGILRAVGFKFRRMKSGVTRSLERGRRPEIDALNGYVEARGHELGVPTPMNSALTRLVYELLEGKRKAAPEVRNELMPFVRPSR